VRGDGFTDHGPLAVHDVENSGWQPRVLGDVREDPGTGRCDLTGLENDCVTGEQRWRDLRNDLVQWVVPGGYSTDNAEALTNDQRVADLLCPAEGFGFSSSRVRRADG
jgi:hypothetical protein